MTHLEDTPRIFTDEELTKLYKSHPLGDGDKAKIEEEIRRAYQPREDTGNQASADRGDTPSQGPDTGA